jgi:hypothetical protein
VWGYAVRLSTHTETLHPVRTHRAMAIFVNLFSRQEE